MELLEAASAILADLFLQSIDSVIIFATDHQNYSSPPEFVVVEWIHELTGPPDTLES